LPSSADTTHFLGLFDASENSARIDNLIHVPLLEFPMARPEASNLWLAFDSESYDLPGTDAQRRTPEEAARSRATLQAIKEAIARMEQESRQAAAEQARELAARNPPATPARLEPPRAAAAIESLDSQLAAFLPLKGAHAEPAVASSPVVPMTRAEAEEQALQETQARARAEARETQAALDRAAAETMAKLAAEGRTAA
jgi:hypothetical protein